MDRFIIENFNVFVLLRPLACRLLTGLMVYFLLLLVKILNIGTPSPVWAAELELPTLG